jgi:hypothetical protein
MNRRILFSILTLLGVCILCTGIISGIVFYTMWTSPAAIIPTSDELIPPAADSTQTDEQPLPLETPLPEESAEIQHPTPDGTARPTPVPPPPALASQMDEIQQQVISLRGLQPDKPVVRALISPSDLQKKVETDFFKDYSNQDAVDDTIVLSTLGLLPKNFELRNLYLDLYSEQIAGFYDNETKEMFVVQGKDFGGIERMTYAHEFTHTLQDQTYDLKYGLKIDDDYCETETEYCSAVTALIEGDASLTESRWLLGSATDQDRNDIQSFYRTYSSPIYDSAPQYMQKDFIFPYLQGLEFVNSLVDRGGYAMIDKAYKNPPVSTEQILHPDKYPAEKPVEVNLPDMAGLPGSDWQLVDENVIGEWYTYLILSNGEKSQYRLPDKTARTAAAGWGGDRYAIYTRKQDGAVILALKTRWDTEKDAGEFFEAFRQYGGLRWGDPLGDESYKVNWSKTVNGEVLFEHNGTDTVWLITPDNAIQQSILGNITVGQIQN